MSAESPCFAGNSERFRVIFRHGASPWRSPLGPCGPRRDGAGFRGRKRGSARTDRNVEGFDIRRAIGALGGHLRRTARVGSGTDHRHAAAGQRRRTAIGRAWNEAAQAQAQHRRAAGASAPVRTRDRAGFDALPVLLGSDASDRRGDQRGARSGSRVVACACARSVPNTPAAPARARSSRPRRRRGLSRAAWRRRR